MSSPASFSNQALDLLVTVQKTLSETHQLLDLRSDSIGKTDGQETITELRALLNTVRGTKSLVELQLRAAGKNK